MSLRRGALRRLFLLGLVALALAPGTWLRSDGEAVRAGPLESRLLATAGLAAGPLPLRAAWHLSSRHSWFGGFSALVADGDRFHAFSDKGRRATLHRDGRGWHVAAWADQIGQRFDGRSTRDIEAATRDPASGAVWLALEQESVIARFDRQLRPDGFARPKAMRGWSGDYGPEAMVRLADGRFLVFEEGSLRREDGMHRAVMFAGDPVEEPDAATAFDVRLPPHTAPVDSVQMPDGRVLVLARGVRLGLRPGFVIALFIGDPAAIRPGAVWPLRKLADIRPPLPVDNFEAMTIQPRGDGGASLWLMSDDNFFLFQRTLLLEFDLGRMTKERGAPD